MPPGLRTHKAFSNVPWVPKASIATSTPRPSVSSMICSTTSPEIDRKVRAHGLGDREALGHRVDANDGRRARQLRPGDRAKTEGAEGEDRHGVADMDAAALRPGKAGRHDIRTHQDLFVAQTFRYWTEIGHRVGNQDVVGLATIDQIAEFLPAGGSETVPRSHAVLRTATA